MKSGKMKAQDSPRIALAAFDTIHLDNRSIMEVYKGKIILI